jgi:hypothetical protein
VTVATELIGPPTFSRDLQSIRCGDRVVMRWGENLARHEGKVVKVTHDNTDDCVVPFSQVTVRLEIYAGVARWDVVLSGPMIRYYLVEVLR